MAEYPYYPRRTTVRLGLLAVAAIAVLAILGFSTWVGRDGLWEVELPRHPSATRVMQRQSRSLGWCLVTYTAHDAPEAVRRFYDEAMPADGWFAASTADGARRWRRGDLAVELDLTQPAAGGDCTVTLLLTASGPP